MLRVHDAAVVLARENATASCRFVCPPARVRASVAAPYLIVVSNSTVVGTGPGTAAFHRVDRVEFLKFQPPADYSALTAPQQRDESQFLRMLASIFRTQSFYFGVDYEITHSAQRTLTGL